MASVAIPASQLSLLTRTAYLLVLIGALLAFSGRYDPDYEGYRLIYELGGAWLSDIGRDPAFVFIVKSLNERLSYEDFRLLVAGAFGVGLWVFAARAGFAARTILFLAPLVFLKFHVQIREGMALLLWLLAMSRGFWFWVAAVVSCGIHIGVAPLWAARLLEKPWLIFLIFATYGFVSTPLGRSFFPFVETEAIIRDTGFGVDVAASKITYWSLFIILPLLAATVFERSALNSAFGTIGAYGLLGFFPIAVSFSFVSGSGEGEFSNVLRVANTLITLLGIQLSISRPRHPLTWTIGGFAVADVVRLLLPG